MAVTHQITAPHQHFGGQGQALHFASANGYPPGAYRAFLEPFAESHEVIASLHRPLWDAPGAIESFTSWEVLGADLRELVSQLQQPVISLGHSMGTASILMAAIQRPELFKSLILIEPVLVPRRYLWALKFFRRFSPETIPLVKKTLARVDRFSSRQEAFEHYRPKSVFSGISDEVLWDYVQHGFFESEQGEFTLVYSRDWEARCYTLVHNLWHMLPQLKVPTLAIRAQRSNTLATSSWEKWRAMSSDVDFLEIEDCGHLLPFEKPEQLSREILTWIEARGSS